MSCSKDHRDGFVPGLNIRTDLAIEAHQELQRQRMEEVSGVETETAREDGVNINRVHIKTGEASAKLGRPPGRYVTLDAPDLRKGDVHFQDRLSEILSREIEKIAQLAGRPKATVMVVGLGNWNVTPDSLGPKVVRDLLVTRHIFELHKNGGPFSNGYRSVSAFSPGVMGLTGIETGEIIQSIASRINPDLIIAVDALAAYRLERLHTTVQIADTGVIPGSGVQNRRLGITPATMGVPVVAIGVPTVVDASTIAGEAMEALIEQFKKEARGAEVLAHVLEDLNWEERQEMINEVLEPFVGKLMVTPKEIDTLVEDISQVIAGGINAALHEGMSASGAEKFLQ